MRYTLIIPGWRPALDNELFKLHWAMRARVKKRDAQMLWLTSLEAGIPIARGRRAVALLFSGRYGRGYVPDHPATLKSCLDGMVHARLLMDDSPEYLALDWPPAYVAGPRGTVIVLEDLP